MPIQHGKWSGRVGGAAVLLFALGCGREESAGSAFDRAEQAVARSEFDDAAELFAEAARQDVSRRDEALVRLANVEWRVFGRHDAARARLARIATYRARLESARLARERADYRTAREEVRKALAAAKTPRERQRAEILLATVVVRDPRSTGDELRATAESMRSIVRAIGPLQEPSRLLAQAGLRAGDGAAALEGVDGYYHVSPSSRPPQTIAAGHAELTRILLPWRGTPEQRPAIARALGAVRFFEEAALVSNEGDVVAYARALRRLKEAANDYYRQVANGDEDGDDLHDAIDREMRALWAAQSWARSRRYDREEAERELAKRYGLSVLLGKTGGHIDTHIGHVVIERSMRVEQYGHAATLRFVALDSIVSNGYSQWANDDASGDGGWATAKEIVQVRPLYANGPLLDWQRVHDPLVRDEDERKTAEETARDVERERTDPIGTFPGLAMRLRRQYLDSVAAALRARGLTGTPLRDAFIARVEQEGFTSSIVLHEGRHAIDAAEKRGGRVWELEYRAKLAEVSLAPSPRAALAGIVEGDVGGDSPHGKANARLAGELAQWMEQHRAAISGLDPKRPPFPQLDRLTDEQMRAAVRSLDELAR